MEPPSGGPIDIKVTFLGGTGTPRKIVYDSVATITEVTVTSRPRDGWQLIELIYDGLPPRSQR